MDTARVTIVPVAMEPAHVRRRTMDMTANNRVTAVMAHVTMEQMERVRAHALLPTPSAQIVLFHGRALSLDLSVYL